MQANTQYDVADDVNLEDAPETIRELAERVVTDEAINDEPTSIDATVKQDSGVWELYVREYGNTGRRLDDTGDRCKVVGDGSPVSKRVQDLAREVFPRLADYRVTQYEDSRRSETTIEAV